jgi:filamentous hemagglutinin
LKEDRIFLRVHGEGNQARSWMMRPDEISGLSPAQIKERFALPELPEYISEVHVPRGTRLRVGTVGRQPGWGGGGGTQYELLDRLPEKAFKNRRPLE